MATEMIMPKVDMDQETGTVVEWLKSEGQAVEKGETILVIETDKIAIDIEAPATGILGGITAFPNDVVPIGTVIAYIGEEGEELPEPASDSRASTAEAASPTAQPTAEPKMQGHPATPLARNMAEAHELDLSTLDATGPRGKITKADVQKALELKIDPENEVVIASPAARRTARLAGVDLEKVEGTGPGGRIQAFDVEDYLSQQLPKELPPASRGPEGESIPLVGMRRTIAERLTQSYQAIPHIQFTARVDTTNFTEARQTYNELARKRGDEKVSVSAMLVKLVAPVLVNHRMVNSSLIGDEILIHQDINIGLAVALEDGLIVPVIHNADQKGIRQIALETNNLISRAREGHLTSSEVKGATFTVSNLGPYGVEQFNAIINPPEAGILAIGATTPEPTALPDGEIAVRPIMKITLSADHRIIDGAVAARFIGDLKTTLENPLLMNY